MSVAVLVLSGVPLRLPESPLGAGLPFSSPQGHGRATPERVCGKNNFKDSPLPVSSSNGTPTARPSARPQSRSLGVPAKENSRRVECKSLTEDILPRDIY